MNEAGAEVFSFTVVYRNDVLGYSSSVSGAERTAEDAWERGIEYHRRYYEGLGYRITRVSMERVCAACDGRGTSKRPTRGRYKAPWTALPACTTCKGSGVAEVLYSEGANE